METYKAGVYDYERQEGDTSSIVMELFSEIVLSDLQICFRVQDRSGATVFVKNTDDWQVDGSKLQTELHESDTFGRPGAHLYEMQVWNNERIHTIKRGTFNVIPSRIRAKRH